MLRLPLSPHPCKEECVAAMAFFPSNPLLKMGYWTRIRVFGLLVSPSLFHTSLRLSLTLILPVTMHTSNSEPGGNGSQHKALGSSLARVSLDLLKPKVSVHPRHRLLYLQNEDAGKE